MNIVFWKEDLYKANSYNEEMLFHVFKKYKTVNFVNENNIFYEPSYSILFVDSFSA